jgi:ATP-dependent Lon protease
MKESVKTSLGWIRANADNYYKIDDQEKEIIFDKIDIHIHFPAASIPKVIIFYI